MEKYRYYKALQITAMLTGPLLIAIGINMFIAPNNLAFGGVSGASIVIEALTGIAIHTTKLVLITAILIIGLIFKGKKFFVKSAIPSLLIPLYVYITAPLQNFAPDIFISVLYGAIFMGIGIGTILAIGGSTAGPDTIAEIIEERFGVSAKYCRIGIDIAIILSGAYVFGIDTALYSVVLLLTLHEIVDRARKYIEKIFLIKSTN